jgi:hypothetical protein
VVWEHELAHPAGLQICHTSDCMNLVPVLLAWHSILYNRQALHTKASYQNGWYTNEKGYTQKSSTTNKSLMGTKNIPESKIQHQL